MEYAVKGGFVDDPTLFACNRDARFSDASISRVEKAIAIDTGKLRLEYRPNGKPFSAENLRAVFPGSNDREVAWTPGSKNECNLGGPVATLDGWSGPRKLPDGLLSRDGWCLIDDSGQPLLRNGWIAQRMGGAPPKSPLLNHQTPIASDLDWYLFAYGGDYREALGALASISGKVPMPRKHVLGSWYCRWHRYTADDFREIVREYKAHDFPLDILVMDMDWHTQSDARSGFGHARNLGWTGYTWNKELIPDPKALLDDLKKDRIFVTLNDHPCDGMREHEENYPLFMQLLPVGTQTNPEFSAGDQRYMDAFFKSAHAPTEREGVDFWWLDWQQDYIYPSVRGIPYLEHLPWLNYLYYRASEAGGKRGASFSRWGGWGDHRHPIHFSGDTKATWDMLAFQVSFSAISGNSGCFYWAHDIGGFTGERNPEMFTRWVQFGALSAALRVHSCGDNLDRRPWLWGEPFVTAMRSAYKLRVSLMPYLYLSVRQCYDENIPLLRPMYLDYPANEEAYRNPQQYMLGDRLLAAPIAKPGTGSDFVVEQDIWFPPGTWHHFLTGEKVAGNTRVKYKAGIGDIPLFVKGGAPIPLQADTPRMTTTPLGALIVRIFPGEDGSSTLYEDDGQTKEYQSGQYAKTVLESRRVNDVLTVGIGPAHGTYKGQVAERGYRIELPSTQEANTATLNGHSIPVEYNRDKQTNVITIPDRPIGEAQTVTIQAAVIDTPVH